MPGGNVLLELLVPRCRVELREPIAESQKLLTGELADGGFDLVNGAHIWRINRSVLWASAEAPRPAAGAGNLRAANVGKPGKGGGFHTARDFVEDWTPG